MNYLYETYLQPHKPFKYSLHSEVYYLDSVSTMRSVLEESVFYKSLTGQLAQGTERAAFPYILRKAEVVIYGETAVQQGSGVFSN